ncbi:hypothetical protein QTG54_002495 [Skeletonema marinoi]|uniref:Uncharacterized protein n=1 Tax=Skeletonema marinoi TaxID=267567 RepID=A0AAD8YL76_9STRA|nr:hypothetical protein QTG54_002495 [Skeletonema marinoi]
MPLSELRCAYMTCCGKFLCHGCTSAAVGSKAAFTSMGVRCALCREKTIVSDDEILQRVKKRMAANDGDAYFFLGCNYFDGTLGLRKNLAKAVELWLIGASLGSGTSQERLSVVYSEGWIVKKDEEKAVHYERLAAMKGHVISRWNLGNHEKDKGITKVNVSNAVKHWKIAAMAGWDHAMDHIEDMLSSGYPRLGVTVEIYEETLTAYLVSQNERKSDQREKDRGTRDCSVSDQEIARKKRTGSEASPLQQVQHLLALYAGRKSLKRHSYDAFAAMLIHTLSAQGIVDATTGNATNARIASWCELRKGCQGNSQLGAKEAQTSRV